MIQYAIYIFSAIFVSGLVVMAFGGGIAISTKLREEVVAWVFPIIGSAVVLKTIASNRSIDTYLLNPAYAFLEDSGMTVFILRACMWPMLAMCGGFILVKLISRDRDVYASKPLLYFFMAYFVFSSLTNSIFGTVPSFDYKSFYAPLVVLAFYFGQSTTVNRLILFCKTTGLVSIVFGLIAAVIYPEIAVQTNFNTGLIPWPPIRLWGLDSHANTLGPMVVMVLLLEMGWPYVSKKWHVLTMASGLVTLFLTQSKTAWMAFVLAGAVFVFLNYYSRIKYEASNSQMKATTAVLAFAFMLSIAGILGYILLGDFDSRLVKFFATSEGAKLSSMTGRDVIWNVTLKEWYRNFLFGYGPKLWGAEFSAQYHLLGVASNAHNQLVDLLGSSGVLGASAFAMYVFALLKYSIAARPVVGWLPIALLVAMIVRAIPEVPFRLANVLSNDFALHLILVGILFSAGKELSNRNFVGKSRSVVGNNIEIIK